MSNHHSRDRHRQRQRERIIYNGRTFARLFAQLDRIESLLVVDTKKLRAGSDRLAKAIKDSKRSPLTGE